MAKPPRGSTASTRLFQENLRKLMNADRELSSQKALGLASGVGQRSISRILRGEQVPTLDVVHRIAGAFGCETWQVLVPEFDPRNPPLTKQIDEQQQELFKRFRTAAQELVRYEVDLSPGKPPGKRR